MGVVVLDTTVVPDMLGLRAFNEEAALVRVLPGAVLPSTIPGVCGGAGVCPFGRPSARRVAPSHVQAVDPACHTPVSA